MQRGGGPTKEGGWFSGGLVPKRRSKHRRAGLGCGLRLHGPTQVSRAPRLHGPRKRLGHLQGVLRERHRRVEQHRIEAPFHHLASVGGQSQPRVHNQGHLQPVSEHFEGVWVDGAQARADGRGPRHHRLAAHVDQLLTQHQVLGAVGQHLEAEFDELLCGRGQIHRVGLQCVVVADEFEFDPIGLKHLSGHLRGGDHFLHAVAARGVGQERGVEFFEEFPKPVGPQRLGVLLWHLPAK